MTKLKIEQKYATAVCLSGRIIPPPPLIITLTRIGPHPLDDDNLAAACKYVRDQIAVVVGIDDGNSLYTWRYRQRTGDYGVDVEIITDQTDRQQSLAE